MTIIRHERDGLYSVAAYVAVPIKPDLDDILAKSADISPQLLPFERAPKGIRSYAAILASGNSITELVITYSDNPYFSPTVYTLPSRSLEGYTTLHVSTRTSMKSKAEEHVQKVLSLFSEVVDLDMRPDHQSIILKACDSNLQAFAEENSFFQKYLSLKLLLENPQRLGNKSIERGELVQILDQMLKKAGRTPDFYDFIIRMVNRVKGSYHDNDLELSLIYISGKSFPNRIYGVQLSALHEKGCPSDEVASCNQARSFAGFFPNDKSFMFGGSILRPELASKVYRDQESGPVARRDFCNLILLIAHPDDPHAIKNGTQHLTGLNIASPEHLKEIETIAQLVLEVK